MAHTMAPGLHVRPPSTDPLTPRTRQGQQFEQLVFFLNGRYDLRIPVILETSAQPVDPTAKFCWKALRFLFFHYSGDNVGRVGGIKCPAALGRALGEFEDKVVDCRRSWVPKPRQEPGTLVVRQSRDASSFLRTGNQLQAKNAVERDKFLKILAELLSPEIALGQERILLKQSCSSATPDTTPHVTNTPSSPTSAQAARSPARRQQQLRPPQTPSKRRIHQEQVFQTAPSSPPPRCVPSSSIDCSPDPYSTSASATSPALSSPSSFFPSPRPDDDDDDEFGDFDIEFSMMTLADSFTDVNQSSPRREKQAKIGDFFSPSKTGNTPTKVHSDDYTGNGMRAPLKQPDFKGLKSSQQSTVNNFMKATKPSTSHSFESKSVAKSMATTTSFSTAATSEVTRFTFNGADVSSTVSTTFKEAHVPLGVIDCVREESQSSSIAAFDALVNNPKELKPEPLDPTESQVRELVRELEEHGPFAKKRAFASALPFRYRYEAQRMANAREVPVDEVLRDAPYYENYDDFWKYLKDRSQYSLIKSVVERTKAGPWEMAVDQYRDTKANTDDVVTLSGKLEWNEKSGLKFVLNPLRFERGYRFCRRFGSDRFLEVTFSARQQVPQYYVKRGYDAGVVLRGIARWLATSDHYMAGRVWRGFYLEEVKKKKAETKESKVYMFAVDGDDFARRSSQDVSPPGESAARHTPMTVKSLINWHIPLAENLDQKDCKIFQRLPLGLSRTLPTVTLLPEETIPIESPPEKKEIMNDGCALMSRSLAISIADRLGIATTPSCFQGRIAGAKGVWMVARDDNEFKAGDRDYWIQISRDSQLKIGPHPCERKIRLDEEQLTFEVVSWSRPLHPANLNMQLLMILQHGGVRKDHLEDLIESEISQFYEEFKDIVMRGSSVACRKWLQIVGYDESAKKRKTRRIDGFPASRMEQAILLLECGFLPLQLPYLTFLFDSFLKQQLSLLDELKIRISQSTYAYCIADPYGVLKENEIHFAFSKSWEEHGYYGAELDAVDVLVGRLPAHKPSDVQRRRAVYKKELRHFRDVMVFPTTGDIPLASMLSGGDYDGDEPWICWDPDIVNAFHNTEFRKEDATPASELGLVNHSTPMARYDRPDGFNDFLAKMFGFSSIPSQLGLCTVQHEKLCYAKNAIDSPQALKLADLLGNLVDAPKAGLELTSTRWKELRNELGLNGLHEPAYKATAKSFDNDSRESFIESFIESYPPQQRPNMDNIIDYLRFKVIETQCEHIKQDFSRVCKEKGGPTADADLIATWDKVWDEAISEYRAGRPELKDALMEMRDSVKRAHTCWLQELDSTATGSKLPYHEMIDRAAELLEEVKPPRSQSQSPKAKPDSDSDPGSGSPPIADPALRSWLETWQRWDESWVTLRASCVYKFHGTTGQKFPWYAAGPTLCVIKAKAMAAASGAPLRVVIWDVYRSLRVHGKAARRLEEEALRGAEDGVEESASEGDEGDEGNVFVDANGEGFGDDVNDGGDTEPDTDYGEDDWVSYAVDAY